MEGMLDAFLFSDDGRVSTVKVYRELESPTITVIPKSTEPFLFFLPEEVLVLEVKEADENVTYHVLFQEIKLIGKRTYYIFHLQKKPSGISRTPSATPRIRHALYTTKNQSGVALILNMSCDGAIIVTSESLDGREVELLYREKRGGNLFTGSLLWHEPKQTRHYYGLSSK